MNSRSARYTCSRSAGPYISAAQHCCCSGSTRCCASLSSFPAAADWISANAASHVPQRSGHSAHANRKTNTYPTASAPTAMQHRPGGSEGFGYPGTLYHFRKPWLRNCPPGFSARSKALPYTNRCGNVVPLVQSVRHGWVRKHMSALALENERGFWVGVVIWRLL